MFATSRQGNLYKIDIMSYLIKGALASCMKEKIIGYETRSVAMLA